MHTASFTAPARRRTLFCALLLSVSLLFTGCASSESHSGSFSLGDMPAYSGEPYVTVNDNQPYFTEDEITTEAFEEYSPLDALGRCGTAYANICPELMPTEKRTGIGMIKPAGWHTVRYDDLIKDKYLYNRCHLIGFQLAGENANEKNLITGTRYLNVTGMLPFEDLVADYVKDTENHVLYRVTPIYNGDELVAQGVLMEGLSVEDNGKGVCFNAYVYNVQPGVTIDYATGDSWRADESKPAVAEETEGREHYILNTGTMKFHRPDCSNAATIKEENRQDYIGSRDELLFENYSPCGHCKP